MRQWSFFIGLPLVLLISCGPEGPDSDFATGPLSLIPSDRTVAGMVPLGSEGFVLTTDLVPCVGDPSMKQVICAAGGDWSTATTFGREGRGPAELQTATVLGRGTDGSVIVSDRGNRRLAWVRPEDGTLVKTHPAPSLFRTAAPEEAGLVIGSSAVPSMDFKNEPLSVTLVAVNSETGAEEWKREFVVPEEVRDPEHRMLISPGWQLPDGTFGTTIARNEIGYWSAQGDFLGVIVSPEYVPRDYSEAEAVEYWEGLNRGLRRMGGMGRDSAETVRERMSTVAPRYRGNPRVGPEGTLWFLCNTEKGLGVSEFEVFLGTDFFGRISIPEVVHQFDIAGTTLGVIKNAGSLDEFGFEELNLGFFEIQVSFADQI